MPPSTAGSIRYVHTDNSMRFETSSSERLRINSDGNIGINEISPDNRLHITTTNDTDYNTNTSNTQNLTNALLKLENLSGTDNSGVNNYVGIQFAVANGATSTAQLNYVRTGNNAGAFQFKARNASSTYPNIMTLLSSGKVGINETSPIGNLHIGNLATGAGNVNVVTIDRNDGTLLYGIDYDGTANKVTFTANNKIFQFANKSGSAETFRIGATGQIGLAGANYGSAGQVIKSNGGSSAPTWQNLHQFYFYGEQDTQQNVAHATYTRLANLGTNDFSIGDSSIAAFTESNGNLTIGASGGGYYYLEMHAGIDDIQAGDYVQTVIGKNGGSTSVGTRISTYGRAWLGGNVSNQVAGSSTSCIANLSPGDVVRFYVYHNEGTTEPTEPNRCSVMGYKL